MSGVFKYGRTAVRSDRGRVRKERIGGQPGHGGAFDYAVERWNEAQRQFNAGIQETIDRGLKEIAAERDRIEQELDRANIFILDGHSFDRPLGSTKAGKCADRE